MDEIRHIEDLQELVKKGLCDIKQFGDVDVKEFGDLLFFHYNFDCEMENRWNYFETISRGLILNKYTGDVVARPFDKFHNWMAHGRYTKSPAKTIFEKLDGSCGILYRDNGDYKICTKKSVDNSQSITGTTMLNLYLASKDDIIKDEWTLIFEIIYPLNRIVVPYGDEMTGLHLLAIRNRFTGEYVNEMIDVVADYYGFGKPKIYEFSTFVEMIDAVEQMPFSKEGFVVEFKDGERFKFKSPEYLKIHRLVTNISEKNIAEIYASGSLHEYKKNVPDEFLDEIMGFEEEITMKLNTTLTNCITCYLNAPKYSRKEYALYIQKNYKDLSKYMFKFLDGKGIDVFLDIFFKSEYGINMNRDQKIEHLKSKMEGK